MKTCPCCSDKRYEECCGLFISGKSSPKTPEQLMRSRYSAYTLMNIGYISRTMRGPAAKGFNQRDVEHWAKHMEWLGLEVLNASMQGNHGFVEFVAKYKKDGMTNQIHELSEFDRKGGKWYYVNGKDSV